MFDLCRELECQIVEPPTNGLITEPMDETLKVKKTSMSTLSHASNQVDNVVDNRFNPVRYNVIAVA